MAGFRNTTELVDAIENGQSSFCSFRKVPSQALGASFGWIDLSMAAGNPVPQYYAASPLIAATLDGNKGIFHGADKAPAHKFLYELGITVNSVNVTGRVKLLDYLLYYPFIDLDDTAEQTLDNTTAIPRYTDGVGVRAMFVCVAPTVGGGSFTYTYVNQNGETKTSPEIGYGTSSLPIANLMSSTPASVGASAHPFLPMASGDTGIRSITSVTNVSANGGLGTLVLVKPLVDFSISEASVVNEFSFWGPGKRSLPRIQDGAFLGMIVSTLSSTAGQPFVGHCKFAWN